MSIVRIFFWFKSVRGWNIRYLQKYRAYFKRAYYYIRILLSAKNSIFPLPKGCLTEYHLIYFAVSDIGLMRTKSSANSLKSSAVYFCYNAAHAVPISHSNDGEKLGFFTKVDYKTHRLQKVGCTLYFKKRRIIIYWTKSVPKTTSNAIHIHHEESWLRWTVIELVNYK